MTFPAGLRIRAHRQANFQRRKLCNPPRPIFLLLIAILSCSACSNINLADAARLADTAKEASLAYQNTITSTSGQIDPYVEAQYLAAPLRHLPEPDQEMIGNINAAQKDLRARAAAMGQLANVYTAFGALASYDANADMKTALTGLAGAAKNLPGGNSLPAAAGISAADAGGLISSEVQKRKVKAASAAIRGILERIVPLIQKERPVLISLQQVLGTDAGVTAVVLWRHGIGSPEPIFSDNIGVFGLKYEKGSYKTACGNIAQSERRECRDELQKAVEDAVSLRARRKVRLQVDLLDSNIDALNALIAAHRQLEAGYPVSLASIAQQISVVEGIVNDVNKSLSPQTPAK